MLFRHVLCDVSSFCNGQKEANQDDAAISRPDIHIVTGLILSVESMLHLDKIRFRIMPFLAS